ncbi:MAG: nuclear transport factor 2 family protein [Methylocystaceae bacterium]|nr:nuclear transport factor 2 family protein [Methylocystaceae bacterium]
MARHDRYDIAKAITQNQSPIAIVEHYLELLMGPAPVAARAYISPDVVIRFTGGRMMHDPTECAAFNKQRYAWVKKRFERADLVTDTFDGTHVVYNIGTLYGAWPDGTVFEGNRYVDRYVLCDGLIIVMDV